MILIILFSALSAVADGVPTVKPGETNDPPSKEETGILQALVSSYSAVREAVKFAYDEITYFERMFETYDHMTNWFNRNKNNVIGVWDDIDNLYNDPEDIFVTLERLETIFDQIDHLYMVEPYRFDKIIAGSEFWWDAAAKRNNDYGTGLIMPNTDAVLNYIEDLFYNGPPRALTEEQKNSMSKLDLERYDSQVRAYEEISPYVNKNWPYEKVRKASMMIASSAMSKSGAYLKWSMDANQNVSKTDDLFKDVKGVNQTNLAAAWYSIEGNNANNKYIRHSLEELKLLMGVLGMDIFEQSSGQKDLHELRTHMKGMRHYIANQKRENENE
jgi:hypothetical protein